MEKIKARIFAGISFVSLSILMLELVLTRIFSVTMWYHFAFMAISLALLGMSVSGICIYLFPHRFPKDGFQRQLALLALLFSMAILLSFFIHIRVPFPSEISLSGLFSLGLTYSVVAVPFFLGGFCLSLAMAHLSGDISKLYFSDLGGAGVGCILTIPALTLFGGPGAVIVVSIFACVAALLFSSAAKDQKLLLTAIVLSFLLTGLLIVEIRSDILRISFIKLGKREAPKLYEGWNSFSRIAVHPPQESLPRPFGWGLSDNYEGHMPDELIMTIDAAAVTVITEFDGDLEKVAYLKHDITALAHYLKEDASVLIIGPGGGRDVLTALAFNQREVYGVEINPLIVEVVNNLYGEFSGHVYSQPGVNIVLDEARSYIARLDRGFDIIQSSFTDTWAATSAGAFILTENNLYTKEAFLDYYHHLEPDGILTLSRWFFEELPGETLRLASLGMAAWADAGVDDPRQHIIIVRKMRGEDSPIGVGTVLLKRSPFLPSEIEEVERVSWEMGFDVIYTPLACREEAFCDLMMSDDLMGFCRTYPIDVSPPTDDRPFFFYMLRPKDFLKIFGPHRIRQGLTEANLRAVFILVSLLLIVALITLAFIIGPLSIFRRGDLKATEGKVGLLSYFTCLGLGYMMVEMSLMQRFILFLGHPVYALSVVLFSMLLFSGIGSLLTNLTPFRPINARLALVIIALVTLLSGYTLFLPGAFEYLIKMETSGRIAISVLSLLPLGLLMGMPFPLGIKLVTRKASEVVPWVWGVNGAASVLASVLAIVVAINSGFTSALLIGLLAYFAAAFLSRRL